MSHPVPEPVGVRPVEVAHGDVDIETFLQHILLVFRFKNDSDGENIEDLLKLHILGFHLLPDGIWCFDPGLDFMLYSHPVEFC